MTSVDESFESSMEFYVFFDLVLGCFSFSVCLCSPLSLSLSVEND